MLDGRESFDEGDQLHAFVIEVGRALTLAGTAVTEAQERLATIATVNGAPDARIVALPTALLIGFGQAGRATIESVPQRTGALRLDQISTRPRRRRLACPALRGL